MCARKIWFIFCWADISTPAYQHINPRISTPAYDSLNCIHFFKKTCRERSHHGSIPHPHRLHSYSPSRYPDGGTFLTIHRFVFWTHFRKLFGKSDNLTNLTIWQIWRFDKSDNLTNLTIWKNIWSFENYLINWKIIW
jgi:hypothetical protein